MNGFLVDSNVILDLFLADPVWAGWSESVLNEISRTNELCINLLIYTEISIGFDRIEDLEESLRLAGFQVLEIPREALFLAGKVFLQYRRRKGTKTAPLPDFFIGAHAAVSGLGLITRDPGRYASWYPTVPLVTPGMDPR